MLNHAELVLNKSISIQNRTITPIASRGVIRTCLHRLNTIRVCAKQVQTICIASIRFLYFYISFNAVAAGKCQRWPTTHDTLLQQQRPYAIKSNPSNQINGKLGAKRMFDHRTKSNGTAAEEGPHQMRTHKKQP